MIPVRLELNNFRSHENSVINFNDLSSALIVGEDEGDNRKSNGVGKCLPGYTILTDAKNGERIEIKALFESLYQREPFYVLGLDKRGKQVPAKVIRCMKTGKKDLVRITMETGHIQDISSSHPVLTAPNKMSKASQLNIGDWVGQPMSCSPGIFSDGAFRNTKNIYSPYYIGGGYCSKADVVNYAHIEDKCVLECVNSDISWGRVQKIERLDGLHDTYDIEIDLDTHIYALDAFYTHNSSIFESLTWVLFGYLEKRQADSVVRWGQPTCEVTLDFIQDNHKYRIIRTRIARYSKMVTQFFKLPENVEDFDPEDSRYKLHGDTNKLTEKAICSVLKSNYDVFVNSSYFRQGSFFGFASGTDSNRHALLGSLLNLEKWNAYLKSAKASRDIHNNKIKEIRRDLEKTAQSNTKYEQVKTRLIDVKMQIDSINNSNLVLDKEIVSLETKASRKGKQRTDLYKFNELNKQLNYLRNQLNCTEKDILDLQAIYEKNEIKSEKNSKASEALESELVAINASIAEVDILLLSEKISQMEDAILDGRAKKRILSSRIQNLTENDQCDLCGHNWDDILVKNEALKDNGKELDDLDIKLGRAQKKLLAARKALDVRRVAELEAEKLSSRILMLKSNIEEIIARNSIIITEQGMLSSKLPDFEDEITSTKLLIKGMRGIEKLKEPDTLHSILESKKKELRNNMSVFSKLTFEQGALTESEKTLSAHLKARKELNIELVEQIRMATIFSQLTKAFSREGVPAIIIDNVIEDLTRATNSWLAEICTKPTRIAFITQKQNIKGDWKETMDIEVTTSAGVCSFGDLSGGEQFRVAFGLRLSLSTLQARRLGGETQLLLLDEVSTSLDPYGIDIFVSIIRQLERSMKVLVITHDDNLKNEFERVITVKGDGNGNSTVEM